MFFWLTFFEPLLVDLETRISVSRAARVLNGGAREAGNRGCASEIMSFENELRRLERKLGKRHHAREVWWCPCTCGRKGREEMKRRNETYLVLGKRRRLKECHR